MAQILMFNTDTSEWEAPSATATTNQDIVITDDTKGLVLTTSIGDIYRITMSDEGTIIITNISPKE